MSLFHLNRFLNLYLLPFNNSKIGERDKIIFIYEYNHEKTNSRKKMYRTCEKNSVHVYTTRYYIDETKISRTNIFRSSLITNFAVRLNYDFTRLQNDNKIYRYQHV